MAKTTRRTDRDRQTDGGRVGPYRGR